MTADRDLFIKEIPEGWSQKNFLVLQDYIKKVNASIVTQPSLKNFKFFELKFTEAVVNQKVQHGLSFIPKDVIQTSLVGTGTLTWNYANFDISLLDITTTGPCVVRAYVGLNTDGVAI